MEERKKNPGIPTIKKTGRIFEILKERWPHARCELVYNTPFQLLLAVVLSAQTTDKSVNNAMAPLIQAKSDFGFDDILLMGEEKFKKAIRFIGLAPTKAKRAILLAQKIKNDFGGQVPQDAEALQTLPGVGRKTAHVVLNVLYGMPTVGVDTHVARLSRRLGLTKHTQVLKVEMDLIKKVPQKYLKEINSLFVFHGRYVCTARRPQCHQCGLEPLCPKLP